LDQPAARPVPSASLLTRLLHLWFGKIVDQGLLTRIADSLAVDVPVKGWSSVRQERQEYLRSEVPNTMYWRPLPSGEWFVVTSYEEYTDNGRLVPRPDHPIQRAK
jgi:hypothetical protein